MKEKIIQWASKHLEYDPVSSKLVQPEELNKEESTFEEDEFSEMEPTTVTATPFGLHRIDSSLHPYREFQLWQADTNFTLTKRDFIKISNVDGVEIAIPITKYKFMIGVGKLFEFSKVRVDIEFILCNKHKIDVAINHIQDNEVKQKLNEIKYLLRDSNRYSVYIFPNGQVEFTSEHDNDFEVKSKTLREAYSYSRGILIENG